MCVFMFDQYLYIYYIYICRCIFVRSVRSAACVIVYWYNNLENHYIYSDVISIFLWFEFNFQLCYEPKYSLLDHFGSSKPPMESQCWQPGILNVQPKMLKQGHLPWKHYISRSLFFSFVFCFFFFIKMIIDYKNQNSSMLPLAEIYCMQ